MLTLDTNGTFLGGTTIDGTYANFSGVDPEATSGFGDGLASNRNKTQLVVGAPTAHSTSADAGSVFLLNLTSVCPTPAPTPAPSARPTRAPTHLPTLTSAKAAFCGATGSVSAVTMELGEAEIDEFDRLTQNDAFGGSVVAVGDLDGDGA